MKSAFSPTAAFVSLIYASLLALGPQGLHKKGLCFILLWISVYHGELGGCVSPRASTKSLRLRLNPAAGQFFYRQHPPGTTLATLGSRFVSEIVYVEEAMPTLFSRIASGEIPSVRLY